ncbi:putative acyl-CoA-binding protein [Tetrabaena socialis]|uniref:Putative acyl-CoA-binding protein n=1 Tax=Tetrabaena socialis TaxID=47790 RepID=A0A2J7ZTQ2_9CHLO|nr:putative acyl-CoA-binding protein [Tetrabaena socialis]|eukprot:PNH03661.1 putative acyl-CoA-binding protein [Tetrabaena socialis]
MGLQEDFDVAAKEASEKLPDTLTNDEKLELYALFKQAKEGDCSIAQPGIFDPKGRAKWSAWNAKKGQSKEDAMQKYIDYVASLKAKHGTK